MTDDTAIRTIGRGRVAATVAAMPEPLSKLDDPRWRAERARRAATARSGAEYHIRKLSELLPERTPAQRAEIDELMRSVSYVTVDQHRTLVGDVVRVEQKVIGLASLLGEVSERLGMKPEWLTPEWASR